MTIAELLGVQFDMQLLIKLSVSVTAVLLVSLAYRFFKSRRERKTQESIKASKDENCKTTPGGPGLSHTDSASDDDLTSDSIEEAGSCEDACSDQFTNLKGDTSTNDATSDISSGSVLNPPHAKECGTVSATRRRSPYFLQKLEGSVGVGRELRQDLEHQGVYSSFLSKAEIKVEDANVVLEGTGDQIARGKIYDYYVESCSRFTTDSGRVLGEFKRNSESETVDYESRGSSVSESPSSLSPIIMRYLDSEQSAVEDPSSLGSFPLMHPARPALLREDSYLSAAEQSELFIPLTTARASEPVTSTGNQSTCVHPLTLSSTDGKDPHVKEWEDLGSVAGATLLHNPAKAFDSADLETLKSKLHLGNCLETLYLAQKQGQTSVQQAALQVMSDNYLQVLRDPNIYGRLVDGVRDQIQKQRMSGRRFVLVADMDPQDWGRNTAGQTAEAEHRRTSSALYYYDDYKDAWHPLCPIPQEVLSKACAMCTMDNYLFVAVGCQGTEREVKPSKRVFCYNPLTSIWKEICAMNEARPHCKLAALEGYIYAIGGEYLSSVERYDPRSDRWTFVAPLPNDTFAVAHHVTVSKGELFVSGGTLKYMLLRYSPKTNTWRTSLAAGGKDRTADMVAVGRFLYRFDINALLGLSVYRYHTVAALWYECSSKRLTHCPTFQCVAMDHTIYCVSRHFTMRYDADDISPAFMEENLSVLSAAKGVLFPFVLSLPDKEPRQTSV